MSETIEAVGQCVCGAVQIEAKTMDTGVGACHCGTCRRWGGGPLMAVDCGTEITFSGEDHITVYDSSAWAERGFCNTCGSHLFYRIKQNGQHIVPAGLFGDVDAFDFDHQVFVDERPAYYQFANQNREMTGAEVFAMYAPKAE